MYKIALIGRPNVGKSTLFNRLIRSKRAITHDRPGITRDRMEGTVVRSGHSFTIIDTGGVTFEHSPTAEMALAPGPLGIRGFEEEILKQARAAIDESCAVVLVVDGREGLAGFDESLASYVRQSNKPVLLLVNKVDGPEFAEEACVDFYKLGFDMLPVSAEHGFNINAVVDELFGLLPKGTGELKQERDNTTLRIALLGRPNAGKSSMVNAFAGEERMIVSDTPGTTRDSVDITVEANINGEQRKFVFVDTAGVRRKTKITDSVEIFSVNSAIKSSTKADVTLLVLDGSEKLATQDKRLLDLLDERKTPFIILINKSDLLKGREGDEIKKDFKEELSCCKHIPVIFVSAKTGKGLWDVLPIALQVHEECSVRVATGVLNRAMQEVLDKKQPPVVGRVRPKFFYLTQAEIAPPTFVFFVSDAERVKEPYARYLEKALRARFGIKHAPMRVHFRSSHNKDKKDK